MVSALSPYASIQESWINASPEENWISLFSKIYLQALILAAKTVNSTPSSSTAPSSRAPSTSPSVKSSNAIPSSSAICCQEKPKRRFDSNHASEKIVNSRVCASRHSRCRNDRTRRRAEHRSASMEFHPHRCHGAIFRGNVSRPPRGLSFSSCRAFAGDLFVGLHRLIPVVYASFLLSVLIGTWLANRRSIPRIGGAVLLGAFQFFLVTNFAVWQLFGT